MKQALARLLEFSRWPIIVGCLLLNVQLLSSTWSQLGSHDPKEWFLSSLHLLFMGLLSLPLLAVAYVFWHREYKTLATLFAGLASLFIFMLVLTVQGELGLSKWLGSQVLESDDARVHWAVYLGALALVVCPYYAASTFFRFCQRHIERLWPLSARAALLLGGKQVRR